MAEELQKSIISDAPLEELIIDKNSFSCLDETITIPANEAAYLRYFIKRRINSSCSNQCKGCAKCFVANDELLEAAQNEVLIEHELISGKYDGHFAKAKEARQKYFTVEPLNGHIASLDKKFSQSKCSANFKKHFSGKQTFRISFVSCLNLILPMFIRRQMRFEMVAFREKKMDDFLKVGRRKNCRKKM